MSNILQVMVLGGLLWNCFYFIVLLGNRISRIFKDCIICLSVELAFQIVFDKYKFTIIQLTIVRFLFSILQTFIVYFFIISELLRDGKILTSRATTANHKQQQSLM